MKSHAIVVLSDGETWSMIEGTSICIITDDEMKALCEGEIDPQDLQPISEISLRDLTPRPEA